MFGNGIIESKAGASIKFHIPLSVDLMAVACCRGWRAWLLFPHTGAFRGGKWRLNRQWSRRFFDDIMTVLIRRDIVC
jgi:hypothetical protein